jgi:hypothetical protein
MTKQKQMPAILVNLDYVLACETMDKDEALNMLLNVFARARGDDAEHEVKPATKKLEDRVFEWGDQYRQKKQAESQTKSEGGRKGNDIRWHGGKDQTVIGNQSLTDAIPIHNSNQNQNENGNTISYDCNNYMTNTESNIESNSQPNKPYNVQDAFNYAMEFKFLCKYEQIAQWYKENDDRHWICYSTKTPMVNWKGSLRNWLKCQADKRLNKVLEEKADRFGQNGDFPFGKDKKLDDEHYYCLQVLASLASEDSQGQYKKQMDEYERIYKNKSEEQPF